MRLRVKPIYGWGWTAPDNSPVTVPGEFELDAHEIPVGAIQGRVFQPNHPLNNLWVVLSQRHTEKDGFYNLSAFVDEPQGTMIDVADMAGFAEAHPIKL